MVNKSKDKAGDWWFGISDRLASQAFVPIGIAALTLAMFIGVFASDQTLSQSGTDLASEFVYWRMFGFGQLAEGHIALWNPHVFSGVPFMGGFQAALFYPFDWIYLILPLRVAINSEIALHVFLIGWFTALWLKRYELHPLARLLGSAVAMFGGPYFLHIYPGHLATLDAMAWIPLILLTLEELLENPRPKWVLIGIFAFSMQLLAGHPQTLFNTIVMCLFYGALRIRGAQRRTQTITALAIVALSAIVLTAVQLWAGLDASSEGTRQGGVPFSFAAMFSFPPENFLTLVVPNFFGNMATIPYWGRCYLWEMSAFFGLTGLTMALFGATVRFRDRFICICMIAVATVLALSNNTPVFALLYRFVPGFDHFRSHSKFLVQATPFLALLTAQGMNQVMCSSRGTKMGATLVLSAAVILGVAGLCLWYSPGLPAIKEVWQNVVYSVAATGESYLGANTYADSDFIANAAAFAGGQFLIGAAVLAAISGLLFFRSFNEKAGIFLAIFGIAELFVFAHSSLATFSLEETIPTSVRQFLSDRPGDYRILELPDPNGAIAIGADDIWGYDPMVLGRYSQFMTYSQGGDPEEADMYVNFSHIDRMLGLVRLKYVFRNQSMVSETSFALPHFLLLSEWTIQPNRSEILDALNSATFDPQRTAILETAPVPEPRSGDGSPGTVELVRGDSDSMVLSAKVTRPSILLITDCYSRYWRAFAEPGSAQQSYTVIPADYTLMAVPLAVGEHHFRLGYQPPGYMIGRWISLAGLILYLIAICYFWRFRHFQSGREESAPTIPSRTDFGQSRAASQARAE